MNPQNQIRSLTRFATILPATVREIPQEDATWQPDDGAWSILEVVTHLADEEMEDFRPRLKLTLSDPSQPWPPTDPERWAVERRYNERDLKTELDRFVQERQVSLRWLVGLSNPQWDKTYQHPRVGPLRAGDLLASWAAHDALHLRQLAKRFFQMTVRDACDYQTDYAGEWKA